MTMPPAVVLGGMSLVRSLAEANIPVILGSDVQSASVLYSRHPKRTVFFSPYESPAFVDELCALGASNEGRCVLFSDDDRAIHTTSAYREKLAPYFYFNYPSHDTVDHLLDKRRFAGLATKLGLPVPKTLAPSGIDELADVSRDITYPCVLKPAHREDWWHPVFTRTVGNYRKAIHCGSRDELIDMYRKIAEISPDIIIQELVIGTDDQMFSSNLYYGATGELKGYFAGHKKRSYPIHAGIGSLIETIDSDEILELSKSIAGKLAMRGYCNIQYKRDARSGEMKILEIHVRNSSWSYLGTAAGVNMAAIGYSDMLGREYTGARWPRAGIKFVDLKRDIKALREYQKAGEWTLASWLRSLRGKKVYDLLSWQDPAPFFMDIWLTFKRKIAKSLLDRKEDDRPWM